MEHEKPRRPPLYDRRFGKLTPLFGFTVVSFFS